MVGLGRRRVAGPYGDGVASTEPTDAVDSAPVDGALGRLALARGRLDRRAELRRDPQLVERLRADPATRVLSLEGARVLVVDEGASVRLLLRPAGEVGDSDGRLWFYLGQDSAGTYHLAAVDPVPDDHQRPEPVAGPVAGPAATGGDRAAREPTRLAGLREVGLVLDDTGAALVTSAVALSNWHATHVRCPRCGAPTEAEQGGWVRRCTADGTEHYPRTDPAVIVTVRDADDRVLLGRNPGWPEGRFSTLAGFVEPGESIEDAVRREVAEEAGVRVGEVRYLASQPWPFPASLMIGCTGFALDPTITVDGVEIAEARWFSREEVLAGCLSGRLLVPPGISISRRLVEHWFGGPLPSEGTWR